MGIFPYFPAISPVIITISNKSDFLFASLDDEILQKKGSTTLRRICSKRSIFPR